jgi:hypothetical protein
MNFTPFVNDCLPNPGVRWPDLLRGFKPNKPVPVAISSEHDELSIATERRFGSVLNATLLARRRLNRDVRLFSCTLGDHAASAIKA